MIRCAYFLLFVVVCFLIGGEGYILLCHKSPRKGRTHRTDLSSTSTSPSLEDKVWHMCDKAFALQQQNLLQEAEIAFNQAKATVSRQTSLYEEILGGEILNAFLSKDSARLQEKVWDFESQFPNSFFLNLFQAFLHYTNGRHEESLACLSAWKNRVFQDKTMQLKKHLDSLNDACFIEFLEVHDCFAVNDFSAGRLVLYKILDDFFNKRRTWNTQIYNKTLLMLSQSFLKESQQSDDALFHLECFKNILFYLEKTISVPSEEYENYLPQQELLSKLKEHIIAFDAQGIHSVIGLMNFLGNRYAAIDMNQIIQMLLDCYASSYDSLCRFCNIFSLLGLEQIQQGIINSFEDLLVVNIKQANLQEVQNCLYILQQFDPKTCLCDKYLLKEEEVKELVLGCNDQFESLQSYLHLIKSLSPHHLNQITTWLLAAGEYLWEVKDQDEKALRLFALILKDQEISNKTDHVYAFIQKIYESSLSNHQIYRLLRLEDFISSMSLNPVYIEDELLASFLEDAKFLCSKGSLEQKSLYQELFAKTSTQLSYQPKVRKFLSWLAC